MAALRGTRRGVRYGTALGAALGAVLLAGCTASTVGTGAPAVPPDAPSAPSATATAAPTTAPEEASAGRAVPLYYVTDTPAGARLAREFRRTPADIDAGTAALTALFAAPTGTVPEHRNTWPAGTALAAPVTHADGVVTVDLTTEATDAVPADPIVAVQQLVHRHRRVGHRGSGAGARRRQAGSASVARRRRHLAPRRAGRSPGRSGPGRDRRSHGGGDRALPGAGGGRGRGVRGDRAVGGPPRRRGRAVRSDVDGGGPRFAPYAFSVELPPGDYEIRVAEDDPSGGAGRPVMTDTRRIVVHLLTARERNPSASSSRAASPATTAGSPWRQAAPGSGVTRSSCRVERRVSACRASRSGSAERAVRAEAAARIQRTRSVSHTATTGTTPSSTTAAETAIATLAVVAAISRPDDANESPAVPPLPSARARSSPTKGTPDAVVAAFSKAPRIASPAPSAAVPESGAGV